MPARRSPGVTQRRWLRPTLTVGLLMVSGVRCSPITDPYTRIYWGGSFEEVDSVTPVESLVAYTPNGLAADFDGDGKDDVVAIGELLPPFTVRLAPDFVDDEMPLDDTEPDFFDAGDFDGDGLADLLVVVDGDLLRLTRDDGRWVEADGTRLGSSVNGIALADMNADGRPDVVATRSPAGTGRELEVVLTDDGGGLGDSPLVVELPEPHSIGRPLVQDVDGDGVDDVVMPRQIVFGSADAEFQAVALPDDMAAGLDLDGDGDLDVIGLGPDLLVAENLEGRSFDRARELEPLADILMFQAVVDFDGSGDRVVAFDYLGDRIMILAGDGDGRVSVETELAVPDWADEFVVLPGDFDGDGRTDLMYAYDWYPDAGCF